MRRTVRSLTPSDQPDRPASAGSCRPAPADVASCDTVSDDTTWHVGRVREADDDPEFLSENGTWATIATARTFLTLEDAGRAAEHDVPAGTVGAPVPITTAPG